MAVKPILDVDVKSESFQRYLALYNKYQSSVAKLPSTWNQVTKSHEKMGKSFADMTAAMFAFLDLQHSQDDDDKKRLTRLEKSAGLWTSIAKSSGSAAKNVLDIGSRILSWGSFIGGIATGASLFGLNSLAQSVSDSRRSSSGLGLSIGQQKAFGNAFGRFVDPGAFLGGINSSVSDLSKQRALYSIGVNPNGSTSDVAVATLKRVWQLAHSTPVNQLGILESSRNLSDIGISVEDLRRFKSTGRGELEQQIGSYRAGASTFGFGDKTAAAWQTFEQHMHAAGIQIEKVFVQKLVTLLPSLNHLSDSIVGLFKRLGKNSDIDKDIDTFAGWIDKLSGNIAKPEFLTKMDTFVSEMSGVADVFGRVFGWAGTAFNATGTFIGETAAKNSIADEHLVDWFKNLFSPNGGLSAAVSASALGQRVPEAMLRAQWYKESRNATGGHIVSPKGAIGIMGIEPATAKWLGIDPENPLQSIQGAARYDRYLLNKYKGDVAEALAAYNWGEGNLDKLLKAHPKDWMQYQGAGQLPKETLGYVRFGLDQMHLKITNATGGNAALSLNQQAP